MALSDKVIVLKKTIIINPFMPPPPPTTTTTLFLPFVTLPPPLPSTCSISCCSLGPSFSDSNMPVSTMWECPPHTQQYPPPMRHPQQPTIANKSKPSATSKAASLPSPKLCPVPPAMWAVQSKCCYLPPTFTLAPEHTVQANASAASLDDIPTPTCCCQCPITAADCLLRRYQYAD